MVYVPDFFELAPAFVKKRVGNIPLITIVAAIALVYHLYVLYGALTNPLIGGGTNPATNNKYKEYSLSQASQILFGRNYRIRVLED